MKKQKTTEDILFYIGNGLIGFLLIVWPLFCVFQNRFSFGCQFKRLTGLNCPACGGTRAFNALIHGRFYESVCYNPVVLYFFGIFTVFMASHYMQRITRGKVRGIRYHDRFVFIGIAILMIHWIVSNIQILAG